MAIRLTGLTSGLDTDAIVSAMVSTYTSKKESVEKSQTKLSWTQDAWKSLNTKIYGLYTNTSNLRFSTAYNMKKTTSSNTTKATVSASNSATNGTQKLNILQTAQSAYLTGGQLAKGTKGSTTMAELGYTGKEAKISVERGDGSSSTVTVKSSSTVQEVIDQMKEAGLNASLDTTNNRIFVSAKESGKDADFNLVGANSDGIRALSALGLSTSLTAADGSLTETGQDYQKYASYAVYGSDGSFDAAATRSAIEASVQAYNQASEVLEQSNSQIQNLTEALTYSSAYSQVQDFFQNNKISGTDAQNRLSNVARNGSNDALVDAKGNIYTLISGADEKGNKVYSYADKDGKQTLVSKETLYKDEDGKTYRKTAEGKYVSTTEKDEDGNAAAYTGDTSKLTESATNYYTIKEKISYTSEDEDGNSVTYNVTSKDVPAVDGDGNPILDEEGKATTKKQYSFTVNGKTYVSDSESGDYVNKSDSSDKISITKEYTYTQTGTTRTVDTTANAYEEYVDQYVKANKVSEDDAKQALAELAANKTVVENFEDKVSDTESVDYSRKRIMNDVHNNYRINDESAMDALREDYAAHIASLKTQANGAEETVEANRAVASIAGEKDDALDAAITDMVSRVQTAAEALKSNATGSAVKLDGQDSIIKLNGATFQNSTNDIEVNGITIHAQEATGDGDENAISITTATDAQGIYDKIKDFLTEYNNIINEMNKLYRASSAKGYEPLTDDEKEAMSDSEVEKWETKIKDSLLRNDQTLGNLITSMTSAMSKSVQIDGKGYSLASFGIKTLGYFNSATNENYAYHIDGDEDDSAVSGNTDKLMTMINEDPDTVMSFFQQLSSNLYNSLGDKMKSTTLKSVYTVYNDKQLEKQYKEMTQEIKDWEDKISTKEEYYYKQFSSMESALAKLNSTQSSLSGFFGA